MAIAWDIQTEIRWKRSVMREAESKNGRYPWNINEIQKNNYDQIDFANSRLSSRCLRVISSNLTMKNASSSYEKINKTEINNFFELDSSRIENFNPDESEYRIRTVDSNPKDLSVALDRFIQGVDDIEKELKSLKHSTKFNTRNLAKKNKNYS